MDTETLREGVAAGEYDAWQADAAVRRLLETGQEYFKSGQRREAADCFAAASDIARYINESLEGWLSDFQARRIA